MLLYTGTALDASTLVQSPASLGTVIGSVVSGDIITTPGYVYFLTNWTASSSPVAYYAWITYAPTTGGSWGYDVAADWMLISAAAGTAGTLATNTRNIATISGATGSCVAKVWLPSGAIRLNFKCTSGTATFTVQATS